MEVTEEKVSREEYLKRKAEMQAYYESEIPFLKIQMEYESLITGLEEAHARFLRAKQMIVDIQAPPPPEPSERKLRKE